MLACLQAQVAMPGIAALLQLLLFAFALQSCQPKHDLEREIAIEGSAFAASYRVKVALSSGSGRSGAQKGELYSDLKRHLERQLERVDALMSNWNRGSEIEQINSYSGHGPLLVSEEIYLLLREAQRIYELSGGAFDPARGRLYQLWGLGAREGAATPKPPSRQEIDRALSYCDLGCLYLFRQGERFLLQKRGTGLQLDLSAIAKGYGADRLCQFLEERGFVSYMVEIGGEVCTGGRKPGGEPWLIGIERPEYEGGRSLFRVAKLERMAMATSGDYRNYFSYRGRRYSHIIDPRAGYPIRHATVSATVVGPKAMTADALATALLVLSLQQGRQLIESLPEYEALWIVSAEDGYRERLSSGMGRHLLQR